MAVDEAQLLYKQGFNRWAQSGESTVTVLFVLPQCVAWARRGSIHVGYDAVGGCLEVMPQFDAAGACSLFVPEALGWPVRLVAAVV